MPPKQSKAVTHGQAYSAYQRIAREGYQIDANIAHYQRLVQQVKAKGNLQTPASLTLQDSERELQAAQATQSYLTEEADRISTKNQALDTLTSNLIEWLKTASDDQNYTRTALATNYISQVFHTFTQFIRADQRSKQKSISRGDINKLLDALVGEQEQAPPTILTPQDDTQTIVLRGVTGEFDNHNEFNIEDVLSVAIEWRTEAVACADKIGELKRLLTSRKEELQALGLAKSEAVQEVEKLSKEVGQKNERIAKLEAAAREHDNVLREALEKHEEAQKTLQDQLAQAVRATEKIKKQFDTHIKNATTTSRQDSALLSEFREAFGSARVEIPRGATSPLAYLTHVLEELAESRETCASYGAMEEEHAECSSNAKHMQTDYDNLLKKTAQQAEAIAENQARLSRRQKTISDQESRLQRYDDRLKSSNDKIASLERDKSLSQAQVEKTLSRVQQLESIIKSYKSLHNEFSVIANVLGLGRNLKPAEITVAVTSLQSKSQQQQSATDSTIWQRAITAEANLKTQTDLNYPAQITRLDEQLKKLAKKEQGCSSELSIAKRDLKASQETATTQAIAIDELSQWKSQNAIKIATMQTQIKHFEDDKARLDKERDKLENKLESAQREFAKLSQTATELRERESTAVTKYQTRLESALEASRQLERDLNASRGAAREFVSQYDEFMHQVKGAIGYTDDDQFSRQHIVTTLKNLFTQLDGVRTTHKIDQNVDISDYITRNLHTNESVREQTGLIMKPLRELLHISEQQDLAEAIRSLVNEKSEALKLLEKIPLPDQFDDTRSVVKAKIDIILGAIDKLQSTIGTYDTVLAYADEVNRLKQSDQSAKAMSDALAEIAGNSGVDKINELKTKHIELQTKHTELQTVYGALNVTTSSAAQSLITNLKADCDKMSEVRKELEVTTNEQVLDVIIKHKNESVVLQSICAELIVPTDQTLSTITGNLIPRSQEYERIYKALNHSQDGTASTLIEDLKKTEIERTQIIQELGSSFRGTAVASIKALNNVKAEHEGIYKALNSPEEGKAAEVIGTLKHIETEYGKIHDALGISEEGKALGLISDLKDIRTERSEIYEALGTSEEIKAVETIKSLRDSYDEIKAQKQEIHDALELPEDGNATQAINSLRKIKTENLQIYKALDLSQEGKAAEVIGTLKDIETEHGQIYGRLRKSAASKEAVSAIRVLQDAETAYNDLRHLINDNDQSSSSEEVEKLRTSAADYLRLKASLSADEIQDCLNEINDLKDTKEAFNALAQLLPGRDNQDNQPRIAEIIRLKETDKAFKSLIGALPTHDDGKHAEEVQRLNQIEKLQKRILQNLPANSQGPVAEVERLKTADNTIRRIRTSLALGLDDDLATEINNHKLASSTLDIIKAKLAPLQRPVQDEVENIKAQAASARADLKKVDQALELNGRERIQVVAELRSGLENAKVNGDKYKQEYDEAHKELIDISAALAPQTWTRHNTRLGLVKKWRQDYVDIHEVLGPLGRRTIAQAIQDIKTELTQTKIDRDVDKATITAVEQALQPLNNRALAQAIQDIKAELARTKIDRDMHQINDRQAQATITTVKQALHPLNNRAPAQAIQALQNDLRVARDVHKNCKVLSDTLHGIEQALMPLDGRSIIEAIHDLQDQVKTASDARDARQKDYSHAQDHISNIERALNLTSGRTVFDVIRHLRRAASARVTLQNEIDKVLAQINKPSLTLLQGVEQLQVTIEDANEHFSEIDEQLFEVFEADEYIPGVMRSHAIRTLVASSRQLNKVDAALSELGQLGGGLSAVQIIKHLTRELLTAIRDLVMPDVPLESLDPKLSQRLITVPQWASDDNVLQHIVVGWQLTTSASTLSAPCSQIVTRLRLLLFSEIPVPLQVVEALFSPSQQCSIQDLTRVMDLLEVLLSSEPALVDEVHAFVTARMLEFIIRGLHRFDSGEAQVSRLIASWTGRYQLSHPLLIAYSRWFSSFQTAPLTMPRIFEELHKNGTIQAMHEPTSSRVFYCNVLPGYHLVVDGHALVLFEETSLELDLILCLISFPNGQIPAFTTNGEFERVNPVLHLHMRSLWLRGTM